MRLLRLHIFTFLISPNCSCKPVSAEQNRYRPFVKLFNDILDITKDLALPNLRNPQLNILFHRSDLSDLQGDHDPTSTKRSPDIGIIKFSTAKEKAHSENQYLGWSEFASVTACEKPFTSFSWLDMLSVVEFKLYEKTLAIPPQEYDATLRQIVAATKDVYGKLRTTPTLETSRPTLPKKTQNPPAPPPEEDEMSEDEDEISEDEDDDVVTQTRVAFRGTNCSLYPL